MEGRPIQYCEDCIEPLTVKHVLTVCPSYYDDRRAINVAPNTEINNM